MSLVSRVIELADAGVDIQMTTILFRSEGIADIDIASAYDEVTQFEDFSIEVERGLPRFVR